MRQISIRRMNKAKSNDVEMKNTLRDTLQNIKNQTKYNER